MNHFEFFMGELLKYNSQNQPKSYSQDHLLNKLINNTNFMEKFFKRNTKASWNYYDFVEKTILYGLRSTQMVRLEKHL